MKFLRIFSLISIFFFIVSILYGALLRHYYLTLYEDAVSNKYPNISKYAVFFAEIPTNIKTLFTDINSLDRPNKLQKHKNKSRLKFYNESKFKNGELILLSRYDGDLEKSIVEIIDISTFKVLHTYSPDFKKLLDPIDKSLDQFSNILIEDSPIRFIMRHPLLLEDGSLIFDSDYTPIYKIDFCSNLIAYNESENFHHSKNFDSDLNFWTSAQLFPFSDTVEKEVDHDYWKWGSFNDDAIVKLDTDLNVLYKKSVIEILLENNLETYADIFDHWDPIHLNDIEPALFNSKYFEEGDIFLSIPGQHAILHYRPSTETVIDYIKGEFSGQHDVDIISDKEISIFNNDKTVTHTSKYSDLLIYNLETKKFTKILEESLKKDNLKTDTEGLADFFENGSILIEEHPHGRAILYDKNGEKIWEFINKDSKGDTYLLNWSRVIQDKYQIETLNNLISQKDCK